METIKDRILIKINQAPEKSGCYFWKDYTGKIIYIGKAKNLKNRLKQYLTREIDSKSSKMMENAIDFDFIVTNSETESLITESNLIAKYKPKYNILLREQTTWNYLVITNEKHPKAYITRNHESKKIRYKFGPITDEGYKRKLLMEIINRAFPFRKCKQIPKQKCLYYDLGQCLAPCINEVNPSVYDSYIEEIKNLFKNKNSTLLNRLVILEKEYASNLEFEKAKDLYEVINLVHDVINIININNNEYDVFGFYKKDDIITMVIFGYEENKLVSKFAQTSFMKMEDIKSITEKFIFSYYFGRKLKNKSLITSMAIYTEILNLLNLKIIIPSKNNYFKVVDLAIENAKASWQIESLKLRDKYNRVEISIDELKVMINSQNLSLIELYDNSHIFNDAPIGVKVAFINGEKRTNLYRKYNIHNLEKKSDSNYMQEVILRRFKNSLSGKDTLPNLIIVDGGIQQVNAALTSLRLLNLEKIVQIIGLVKNSKHQTDSIIMSDGSRIQLEKRTNVFYLLSNMQDEVHRFAINSFRKKRHLNFYKSELLEITGVGEKTVEKLLSYFETVNNVKKAPIEEIQQVIGLKIAQLIIEFYKKKDK